MLSLGIALGLSAALLFAIRDNLVRWAARGSDIPGFVAARAFRPFVLSGLVYGLSYACLYSAFDQGRVTVVVPLVATESLWAVLISMIVLRQSERIGPRLLVAAGLVVGGGALISSFR
jgi:uncharacterized membrane protein